MAKLFDGKKLFASAIKPTGGQPLDDRTVVSLHSDLTNASTFVVNGSSAAYKGMLVAVVEDQQVYMLVDETNITSEESWVAVGSGNGSLAVDTYGEAVALATDDNIGQIIYVKTTSDYDADGEGEGAAVEYSAAPYIVIGNGQLQKLAASTASGDLDADVAELQTKVSSIETKIGAAAEGEDAATGLYKEIADAEAAAKEYTDEREIEIDKKWAAADAQVLTDAKAYTDEREVEIDKKWAAADAQVLTDAKADAAAQIEALDLDTRFSDADTAAQGYASAAQSAAIAKAEELDEAMDTRVKALEEIDHDAYIAADTALENKINVELGKKVDKAEGERLMTEAEGAKLAGIAEGAQVNVIEKVIFNGAEVVADAQTKTITLTTPQDVVRGLADGENVLSLDSNSGKLGTTLSIEYFKDSADENKPKLRLKGIGGAQVGDAIDISDFVKDGMLSNVELEENPEGKTGTYLVFTWNEASGKSEPMYVPVTDLIDVYVAGNGVSIDGKTIAAKVKAGDAYLEVTTEGIASKGIDNAITTAKNELLGTTEDASSASTVYGAKKYADEKSASALTDAKAYTNEREIEIDKKWAAADAQVLTDAKADAAAQIEALDLANTYDAKGAAEAAQGAAIAKAEELNTAMDTRVKALEEIDHDHENKEVLDGITAGKVASWDAAEQNAKDYADQTFVTKDGFNEFEAEYEEKLNAIEAGAEVNVIEAIKVNGIDAEVSEGKVAEVKVDADDIEIGTAIKNGEEEKYAANTKLNVVLQGIQDSIRGAIAGGVNSVAAGDTVISVNSADANNPVISLKVEEATEATVKSGHIEMIKGENGLYGMMYYDGDDSEVSA